MSRRPIYVEEHNFLRPPIDFSTLYHPTDPITFQIIGMDDCNSETTQWEVERRFNERVRPNYWGYFVRLFGVDEQGHSVSVYVNGFKPFLYVQTPESWTDDDMEHALSIGATGAALEYGIKFSRRDIASFEKTWRTQFYGFTNFEPISVFKLNFNNAKAREKFIELCDTDRTWGNYNDLRYSFWLWDACVPPLTQFSNVHNVMPSTWVTVAARGYRFRDSPAVRQNVLLSPHERRTRAQLDVDCCVDALTCNTERTDICPFLILCEDIEVAGPAGLFPEPEKAEYPVIQIGATVQRFGDAPGTYLAQCCFCLRETENLVPERVKIYWFEDEAHLLEAYYRYWTDCVDPELRVAFNQYGFDGPYLYNRYMKLLTHMIPKAVRDGTAPYFERGALDYGKVRNCRSRLETKETESRAHGGSKKHVIEAPGRAEVDVMVFAREEWKLIVGLNVLAAEVLGDDEQKDDIHFSQITPMFNTNAHERGRLAKYCVRDTELPLMILEKKAVIIEQIEKSRLTGVTLHTMFNRKQTVRVETLLFREAHRSAERYSIPQEPFRFIHDPHVLALFRGEHGKEGALVLPATANFYKQPICTLDFAGLYPSIIRGYGLCYTTLILDPKYHGVEHRVDVVRNKQVGAAPYTLRWAKLPDGRKSLLYKVLTNILDARAAAKTQMKQHKEGSLQWLIYNGRQLALKAIANSAYGYTVIDHDKCKLPCAAIGVTVTHYGREMINRTRQEVHERIPGSQCLYGDTDSVMVKFSEDTSREAFCKAFVLGKQVAKDITALFPKEVSLEFEKIFWPYVLFQQKNYAGILYVHPDKPGKVKISGLASVKSDTVRLVARWTDTIVSKMLEERDYHGAKAYLIDELIKFVREPVRTEDVAISIKMSKEIAEYAGANEVAAVAAAIAARDPGRAPGAGHKVSFVHCLDKRHQNAAVPVDVEWYEANRDRFIIDKRRYLHNLMIENVGKLFDLPTVAHDPYQWFVPFERALLTAQNGGGIAKYLTAATAAAAATTDQATSEIATTAEETATTTSTAVRDDAEFPSHLFKDTRYPHESLWKKKRMKKAEEKQLADECRRLSVSVKSVKISAEKRKLGLPISHFFKTRRLDE